MSKLIVLEGLDGSGKGTQTDELVRRLAAEGRRVKTLDFPDYASPGSALVRLYLDGRLGGHPADTNAYAASMFFAADRYVSYRSSWMEEAADPGAVLVANRYTTANAYHQLSKLPEDEWDAFLAWLWDFEFGKLGLPSPDLVILLDMPERVSAGLVRHRSGRTGRRMDIHETDDSYLVRCRCAAAYVAKKCGWKVIRCADENGEAPYPVEEIAAMVYEAASAVL